VKMAEYYIVTGSKQEIT